MSRGSKKPADRKKKASASPRKPATLDRLIAALQTYQEELRMQNEQLLDAQRALHESRDRYAMLYENAPVGFMTLDRNGVIEEMNLPAAAVLGDRRERIIGRPLLVFLNPADRHIFLDHMIRSRNFGARTRTEMRLFRAGGQAVPVELVTTPIHRPRLGGIQYLTTIVDITERLRIDEQRRATEEAQREAELRHRAAQAASDAKDRFIAVLSHELRTPLTPILAAVFALNNHADLSQTLRPTVEMIRRNVEMEARLIDDLLDITRVTRNKLRVRFETVDAHAIIRDVAAMLASELSATQLHFGTQLQAEQHHVQADPGRLRQIVWNLLTNSIKFTPPGGAITLRTHNHPLSRELRLPDPDAAEPVDASFVMQITDNGIGIPSEAMSRIFRPFEQADESRAGLGLGLAVCKGLLDLHGGTIHAQSPGIDQGATFTVALASIRPPAATPAAEPDYESAREQTPRNHRMRILLAEDHADTARIMAQLLTSEGHDVLVAHSFREALRIAETPVDLIISDIGLPDGSGLELLREIRQRRPVPGIALSGFGTDGDVQRSYDAGFSEHLTKPVNFEQLLDAIQRLTAASASLA